MEVYKTTDNAIWLVVGYKKRSPIALSWTGEVRRLTRPYRKEWQRLNRSAWLEARKYCCIYHGGGRSDYTNSIRTAIKWKRLLSASAV